MIGKFLLIFGLVAMAALFALSLVLYFKDKRMELAVMGFALATALAVSGVTATVRDRADARRASERLRIVAVTPLTATAIARAKPMTASSMRLSF